MPIYFSSSPGRFPYKKEPHYGAWISCGDEIARARGRVPKENHEAYEELMEELGKIFFKDGNVRHKLRQVEAVKGHLEKLHSLTEAQEELRLKRLLQRFIKESLRVGPAHLALRDHFRAITSQELWWFEPEQVRYEDIFRELFQADTNFFKFRTLEALELYLVEAKILEERIRRNRAIPDFELVFGEQLIDGGLEDLELAFERLDETTVALECMALASELWL